MTPTMKDSNVEKKNKPKKTQILKEDHDDKRSGVYYGKCKWFSDKSGYGFVTVESGDKQGKEVFVHYTGIVPCNSTYKTLVCGEYISFDIIDGVKDLQAINVTGVNGGPLMCDSNTNIKSIYPKVMENTPEVEKKVNHLKVTEGIVGSYDGVCKWFNDVSGYGFIVIESSDAVGKDVFVHYSGITPFTSNYRSLVTGEYIHFDVINGSKGLQAVNVRGFRNGNLMCDVNHIPKSNQTSSK
jgi:cold shock domain protein A/Y-box-binding protein 1/Y-box-binding protein 2